MRVGMLGPLEVVAGQEIIEIGGARLRALLIRLALDAGRAVTVESLAGALWPADGPTDPAHALQSLMTRLRRALPEPLAVRSVSGGYLLDIPPEAVDALRFERLAREGRRALRDGEPALAADRLRAALALWRGEPFADVAEAPFATAAAARLSELRLSAIEDRIAAELATAADVPQLVAELEELTASHPLRERLRAGLVQALHAAGRDAEALIAYEDARRLLAEQLGTDPGAELRQAQLAVLRGEEVVAATGRRGNLRAALSSFVGRDEERARLAKELAEGRLVTLVGPGGVGKTRLATTVAAGVAGDFRGGVWLVELAAVTDPDDLPQALIGALGLRERRWDPGLLEAPAGPPDPVSRLVEALSAAETLIVLDNCEHLIDAAARLADELLGRCRLLRVLATSREPLGISGEALCAVPPLGLPAPAAPASEAMAYPAVRLFADRAAAVRAGFAVTDQNVAAVVEVCRRLDGLPLAIELAAARLRGLPVEELAARLTDRFQLLTGGSRTSLPRHRTLRAVVAWSWDLLDEPEQRLAARLAVFPATITAEAAGQVAAVDTMDALASLVDKSLLQVVEGPQARYRMLETIREYGLERLAEAGELAAARAAHTDYFLRLAETAEPHLRGAGQPAWYGRLATEWDNLLAALHFAYDSGDAGTAVRLVAALGHYWTIQGRHAEAASWLRLALDIPGDCTAEARTAAVASYLLNTVLSGAHGRATVAEIQARAGGVDPSARHRGAALIEPLLAFIVDDVAAGLAATERWLPISDPWTRAMLWLARSFLHGDEGDLDGLREDLAGAAGEFRRVGDRWGLATSLTFLAHTRITLGEFDEAIAGLVESVRLLRELDPADDASLPQVLLAVARAQQGEVEQARTGLRSVVESGPATSSGPYLVLALISLGDLARLDGELAEAARQYDAAGQQLSRLPFDAPLFRAMLRCAMGHLAISNGDLAMARRHLDEAVALAVAASDVPIVADAAVAVARMRLCQGSATDATEVLGAAHALRGAPDAFDRDVVRVTRELRDELGERAFHAAYDRGRGRSRAGALALIEAATRPR